MVCGFVVRVEFSQSELLRKNSLECSELEKRARSSGKYFSKQFASFSQQQKLHSQKQIPLPEVFQNCLNLPCKIPVEALSRILLWENSASLVRDYEDSLPCQLGLLAQKK